MRFFGASDAKIVFSVFGLDLLLYVGGFFMRKNINIIFSQVIKESNAAKRIAYTAVLTALVVICNMWLEIKLMDIQFSLTIFASVLCGVFLGGGLGFAVCFLGDLLGWVVNPGGIYMPWIGLSTAMMAFIGGVIMNNGPKGRAATFVKIAIICVLTLIVCSVGINTTGFYIYYTKVGFSKKSMGYFEEKFGGQVTYIGYALIRLLFMGQLWNSLVNYALLFVAVPLLAEVKPLRRFF